MFEVTQLKSRLLRGAGTFVAATLIAAASFASAQAKETITYAYQIDPAFDAAMWALKNGKIESDLVDVELQSLTIPALIQSTMTKQFDVIQSDTIAVPRAASRGLNLSIMSTAIRYSKIGTGHNIYVLADSPAQTMVDLKGKKIGVPSLGSAGFHILRFWLEAKFGVNASVVDGDFSFIETPPTALITGLDTKRFDAGTMLYSQAYKARESDKYRSVAEPAHGMYELWGVQMIPSVNVGYPEMIAERPEAFREFNRMLRASVVYMQENPDEVFSAVAAEHGISEDFLKVVYKDFAEIPANITADDVVAINKIWEIAHEKGMLESVPDIEAAIDETAVRE